MFSANENIVLRQQKRRITEYVESTIPETVLEAGTSVMAMQVSCKAPGCAPLETVIAIVFPRPFGTSSEEDLKKRPMLLEGVEESRGGTFKTTVLKPMADITKDDVLDALPPGFMGGRRTVERTCLLARDVVLNQVEKCYGDVEGKRLMAEYLILALQEYVERGCVAPEFGLPFPPVESKEQDCQEQSMDTGYGKGDATENAKGDKSSEKQNADESSSNQLEKFKTMSTGNGNFVIRRLQEQSDRDKTVEQLNQKPSTNNGDHVEPPSPSLPKSLSAPNGSAMPPITQTEWRLRQSMTAPSITSSSSSIMQKLSEREHAPGIRRPGCPCCDPDNLSNIVDRLLGEGI